MLLEVRTVGRKTPNDGKLEIGETTARRLGVLGPEIPVRVGARASTAVLTSMRCTCGPGGGATEHHHQFLQADVFRELRAEQTVAIELIDGTSIEIALPHDL